MGFETIIKKDKSTEKVIYVSHPYKGLQSNMQDVERIIKSLHKIFPNYIFLSPIHAFGYMYHETEYEEGLNYTLHLMKIADEVWLTGDWESSVGCRAEIKQAEEYNIPTVIVNM